jgi:hypothetical protein
MLDFDLSSLYEVETRVLNQAVKRNIKRFPNDFMFRLTINEWKNLSSQIVTTFQNMSSQSVMTSESKRPKTALPYAFTEQGVAMLSGILNSDKAISMNIAIMRAFVEIRKIIFRENNLKEQIEQIKNHLGDHDAQLNQIYDAIENLPDESISNKME